MDKAHNTTARAYPVAKIVQIEQKTKQKSKFLQCRNILNGTSHTV